MGENYLVRTAKASNIETNKQQLLLNEAEQQYSDMLLNEVLDIYKPGCRYLQQIKFKNFTASGAFSMTQILPYANSELAGTSRTAVLSVVEFIMSFHQIAILQAAHIFTQGLVAGINKMSLSEFNRLKLSLYTVGLDKVKIKKKINPEYYLGVAEITKLRCIDNKIYFKSKFSLDNGGHEGIFNSIFDLSVLKNA